MPMDRKAAYYNPQLKIKVKSDGTVYRVRGTIGGDQIIYPGVTTAYTAHLETIRLLLNAVVSENALFMTADIKDFYLGTPLPNVEYMRISLKHIPPDVQERYNIANMVHNGYVLMEISDELKREKLSKRKIAPILLRLDLDFLGCSHLGLEVGELVDSSPGGTARAPARTTGSLVRVVVRKVIAPASKS